MPEPKCGRRPLVRGGRPLRPQREGASRDTTYHNEPSGYYAAVAGRVVSVCRSAERGVSKSPCDAVVLVEGEGVEGDVHRGVRIRHLARMRRDPAQPNLRQVHLLDAEFLDQLSEEGMLVCAGQMGENVLVRDLNLLALGAGSVLRLGPSALVEITGLRNPCRALEEVHEGLMAATLRPGVDGEVERRAGVMGVVVAGGRVRPGDEVTLVATPPTHAQLEPV